MTTASKFFKWTLATTVLTGAAFYSTAQAQLPAMQNQDGVEYVSGGFGSDESAAFKQAISQFPLALTFASADASQAAYAGDVKVVVRDKSGTTVLDATSEGPYFLAKLVPGQYELQATYNNQTQTRSITIDESQNTHLVIHWDRSKSGPD